MHITSGICTQIVAAVKVALMPLYEMIPVLVSDEKCPNKRILRTYIHTCTCISHMAGTSASMAEYAPSSGPLCVI